MVRAEVAETALVEVGSKPTVRLKVWFAAICCAVVGLRVKGAETAVGVTVICALPVLRRARVIGVAAASSAVVPKSAACGTASQTSVPP